ncbi:MAG: YigZ family protein [Clostridia bacterium]
MNYTTIEDKLFTYSVEINKSKFIGNACRIESVEQSQEFIKQIGKKYYDANHNTYAYVCGQYSKYSDDGEPQGTAGLPILDCLKKSGLNNVCVVVTRYFGGIKLGAGGLIRAYSGTASGVLASAEKVEFVDCVRAKTILNYDNYQIVNARLQNLCKIQLDYSQGVEANLIIKKQDVSQVEAVLAELTSGKSSLTVVCEVTYNY